MTTKLAPWAERINAASSVASQRVAALARQVVRVMPELTVPPLPVWLTAHRELRGTPRLKAR